jgi:hypothetical protein
MLLNSNCFEGGGILVVQKIQDTASSFWLAFTTWSFLHFGHVLLRRNIVLIAPKIGIILNLLRN